MPSPAYLKFGLLEKRAKRFLIIANDKRIRPKKHEEIEIYYHASLAAYVAAWEAYLEELVKNFYNITAKPLASDYSAFHNIALSFVETKVEKFNTPNSENARNFLIESTNYDPISDWIWTNRSMSAFQTRSLLNEILKVRHSFAHGYSVPQYSWNTLPSGRCRLTRKSGEMVEAFFFNLIKKTDKGMKSHLQLIHGISTSW